MDTFLKNYWSIYRDFLHDFESLIYKKYEIVYFCHLPAYILPNLDLMKALQKGFYTQYAKREVSSSKDIQDKFSMFTTKHKTNAAKSEGKVAIHVDKLLRFPKLSINQQFSPSETILLTNGSNRTISRRPIKKKKRARPLDQMVLNTKPKNKLTKINQIPLYYFGDIKVDVETQVKQVQQQARELLANYKDHPLYSRTTFQKWLLQNIRSVIIYMEMTEQLLKKVNISCFVVSTTHSFISRILSVIGLSKGIPSICMQHGIISSELGYIPKIATVDALYGQFEKDWYQKLGIKKDSLEIIGHPRFDQVYSQPILNRLSFYQSLGLNKNQKTIMIVVRGNEDIEQWRKLIQTLNNKQKLNILIKNYPSKQPHMLTKEFTNVFSTQNYGIYDMFPYVDAVIAYSSTVGLEAMLSNKTAFILNKDFPGSTGYYQMLGELMQYDPCQLAEKVIEYFSQPHFKQYADKKRNQFLRYTYPSTQKSIDRLNKLIHQLIAKEG
ncbi:hypothetical protein SAMN04487943_10791 [Gracilibacillus orientalis]|uniref:Lipid-A-disaccharide synthase n=1 Tax=Gracilibacillus orientalis TaxID=334253 RepID=A0A1I4MTS1_9BACI|nr:hypothetical protein [Gracilibacillus orientalis]SFM06701.1 hypothetical protein SAMN04487943_10791 [Gracilibacillus orientalis]